MARRRAALASGSFWKPAAESRPLLSSSGSLQEGQRLAKPGLSGLSSNSSPQIAQVRIGKDMAGSIVKPRGTSEGLPARTDQQTAIGGKRLAKDA